MTLINLEVSAKESFFSVGLGSRTSVEIVAEFTKSEGKFKGRPRPLDQQGYVVEIEISGIAFNDVDSKFSDASMIKEHDGGIRLRCLPSKGDRFAAVLIGLVKSRGGEVLDSSEIHATLIDDQGNRVTTTEWRGSTMRHQDSKTKKRFLIITSVIFLLIFAMIGANLDAAKEGLAMPVAGWAKTGGPLAAGAYVLLVIALIAALIERIVETVVGIERARQREILDHAIEDAERAWKVDKKIVAARNNLLIAELHVQAYRADTRLRTQLLCLFLGALFATLVDLPVAEAFIGETLAQSTFVRGAEIIVVGLLVAGGAAPLHELISSFKKGVNNVANIGTKGIA